MIHLSPSGISKYTLFPAWVRSFVAKVAKLTQTSKGFAKMYEKWPKIAYFWHVLREPAVCHLSPSGISKSTLFPTWAKGFVAKVAKLAPQSPGSAKKYEKWPKIACFCKISREPGVCHLSPSGISKYTLFPAWARSFVSMTARLTKTSQEFGKFFEFVWWSCLIPTPIKFNSENARSWIKSSRIS